MRLTHLHTRLPDMSPALLDRYLRQMVDRGLLTRTRFRERPPRVEVELSESGRELVPIARELARWGLRRMWSAPHEGERVDLDALLRLLVALVEEDAELPHGTLELVLAERAETVRHVLRIERGGVSLAATDVAHAERTPDLVSARIKGSRAAWIAALGPAGDRRQLRISGDLDLAAGVLDLLTVEA
jgi:DNA-binding MarR family transcriptional regulator